MFLVELFEVSSGEQALIKSTKRKAKSIYFILFFSSNHHDAFPSNMIRICNYFYIFFTNHLLESVYIPRVNITLNVARSHSASRRVHQSIGWLLLKNKGKGEGAAQQIYMILIQKIIRFLGIGGRCGQCVIILSFINFYCYFFSHLNHE